MASVASPLADVDQVPWAEFERMGGPATDVAPRLRALVSADEHVRAKAWDWMNTYLCHQGSVYEATAHAVPFLLGMLADEATPDRPRLLSFLYAVVEMSSYDGGWLPDGLDTERLSGSPDAAAAHAAVAAGIPLLLPLLAATDPSVAGTTARLLAWFPDQATVILPGLRALCTRPLPSPERTTALIALGLLAGAAGDRSDTAMLEQIAAAESDPDRWAAGVALARIAEPFIPPAAVAALVAELAVIILDPDEYGETERTYFNNGFVDDLITTALDRLRNDDQDLAVVWQPAVERALAKAEAHAPHDATAVAWGLVQAVDALSGLDPVGAGPLTSWQRVALQALLAGDKIWWSGELGLALSSNYGLPDTPDALAAWLDQRPPA